jgi:glucosamine-6-phosphate deaminase
MAKRFQGMEGDMPKCALTVGLGTILDASEIVVLTSGTASALAVRESFQGGISHLWPASVLQLHPEVVGYIDSAAASCKFSTPH